MSEGEIGRKSGPVVLLFALLAILGIRAFAPNSIAPSGEHSQDTEENRAREKPDEDMNAAKTADRFWRPLKEFRDAGAASVTSQ